MKPSRAKQRVYIGTKKISQNIVDLEVSPAGTKWGQRV